MNVQELLDQFRSDAFDLALPYLWSDTDVLRYMNDAYGMFVRLTGGIGDFTTVEFADGKKRMHNLIFDRVIATEANNNGGSVEDMVATTIAREIIALFTVYNLTLGECDVVINYTATNATNAKRSGDKKLWNGKRAEDVTFQDIRNVLS